MFLPGLLALFLAACGDDRVGSGPQYTELEVWLHAGRAAERRMLQEQVTRFNNSHQKIRINAVILPEGTYETRVRQAALADELPDVLEFNGPFLYPYAWQGKLIPLDKHLSDGAFDDLLPSIVHQGMYKGRLYAVGVHDSGLALYGRRSRLEAAGVRIPRSPADAWSLAEFEELLTRLARDDADGAVLDLQLNRRGEWVTYAFAPALQSAGGDLIERRAFQRASGVLDGPASVAAMSRIQAWIRTGRVDANEDGAAFIRGRVALSWAGHDAYPDYRRAAGDDLLVLPLPDFGSGARTAQGDWAWAVSSNCREIQAAMHFLEFLLRTEEVLAMADAIGAVPGTRSAVARSALYGPGAPLHLMVEQLETIAVPRPQTAAYPTISSAFQEAFDTIRQGGDVQAALSRAARIIDRDIEQHGGY